LFVLADVHWGALSDEKKQLMSANGPSNGFYEALLTKLPEGLKLNYIFGKKKRVVLFYITLLTVMEGKRI